MVLKNGTAKCEIYNTMKGIRNSFSAINKQLKKFPLGTDIIQPYGQVLAQKTVKLPMLDGTGSAHHYKLNSANKQKF
jgi:hypothetical protein